jgi:hypothetical protein
MGDAAGAPDRRIAPETHSLRFYRLGAQGQRRVEHVGAKPALDLDGPPLHAGADRHLR